MCDIQTLYVVEGLNSESHAAEVSQAVGAVVGVTHAGVDLSNGSLTVSGHADESDVHAAIMSAGFSVKETA